MFNSATEAGRSPLYVKTCASSLRSIRASSSVPPEHAGASIEPDSEGFQLSSSSSNSFGGAGPRAGGVSRATNAQPLGITYACARYTTPECGDDSAVRISERKAKTPLSFKELNRMPASVGGIMKHRGDCRRTGINGENGVLIVELRSSRVVEPHVPRGLSGSEEACSSASTCTYRVPNKPSVCGAPSALDDGKDRKSTSNALRLAPSPSPTAATPTEVFGGGGRRESSGAPSERQYGTMAASKHFLGRFRRRKNCELTSNAPRSAREVLVYMRDCRGGGGAARRGAPGCLITRRPPQVLLARPLCPEIAPRKLDKAFSPRSRSITMLIYRVATLISFKDGLDHLEPHHLRSAVSSPKQWIFVRRARVLLLRLRIRAPVFEPPLAARLSLSIPPPPATPSILVSKDFKFVSKSATTPASALVLDDCRFVLKPPRNAHLYTQCNPFRRH
ncbi:hypothetical protein EV122DRAFT_254597 [Schizophyllum commune]